MVMTLGTIARKSFGGIVAVALTTGVCAFGQTRSAPVDPGVRGGPAGAGTPLKGLTADETAFFQDGQARFADVEVVTKGSNNGLGPRFNSNQCLSCHSQPDAGGSSPAQNPLIAVATLNGAKNTVPWFITQNGPVREARFKRSANGVSDGEVHNLFVITGRTDAPGCNIAQPNFLPAGNPLTGQGGNSNIIFRIPTPLFGAGLIEAIPDSAILANMQSNVSEKSALGISGHANAHLSGNVNRSANDGTITRFGWKAQNKSLLMFAGEAYNVEMGITNQLFPQERDETPGCLFNATPEDTLNFTPTPETTGNSNRRSSPISKPLPTSCGCWPHPHLLPRPARKDAPLLQGLVVSTAIRPRLPRAQRSRAAPRPARALRFPIRRRIFTLTFSSTTWANASPTESRKVVPAPTSSEPLLSGASDNASSSAMMDGRLTWWKPFEITRAMAARQMRSSNVSLG